MKRKNIICLIIIFAITFISFICCMSALLYPNMKNNSPTYSYVLDELNKYNCKIEEKTNTEGINYFYKTTDDCDFNIQLITFSDLKIRDEYYNNYLIDVNNNGKIIGGEKININIGILFFSRETNGDNYKSVSLKNNSILYINTELKNRNKALQIKNELGYKYEPNWNNIKYFIIPIISFSLGIVYLIYISLKKNKKNI